MIVQKAVLLFLTGVSIASLGFTGCTQQQDFEADAQVPAVTTQAQERPGDVPYVPTPQPVVDAMLKLANVGKNW